MDRTEPGDLGPRRRRVAVQEAKRRSKRGGQPPPRVGPESRVLVDALGDQRMGDLEEQRPWAGAEQKDSLAIEPPTLALGAEETGVRDQRSPGRRPTIHQATGKAAAARASLSASPMRNGVSPRFTVSDQEVPIAACNHGRPTT